MATASSLYDCKYRHTSEVRVWRMMMSLDPSHWRSASEYEYAESLTAPDLAWEWLRRNVDYQRDYASAKRTKEDPHELTRTVRQSWGLRFPNRSAARCVAGSRLLAARDRPGHCHPHGKGTVFRTRARLLAGNGREERAPRPTGFKSSDRP